MCLPIFFYFFVVFFKFDSFSVLQFYFLGIPFKVRLSWKLKWLLFQFVLLSVLGVAVYLKLCGKEKQLPFSVALFKVKISEEELGKKKKVFRTDLERTPFSTPTSYFELRSLKLHYRLGFNKKTLVGDALNDQRLSHREIVEKWPIYFLPPLGCLNGFLFPPFSSRRTAVKRPLEGRVSAENREGRSQRGSSLAASAIRQEAFHTTGPAVGAIFQLGASGTLRWKIRSGSEGGQSRRRYRFIPGL